MIGKTLILLLAAFCTMAAQDKPLKPGLYAIFDTSEGVFKAELYEKDVANTVKTFVGLAQGTIPWLDPVTNKMVKRPLYNDITFHRVLPEIMIQSGDPTGKGNHNCGFTIKDQILPGLQFSRAGKLAMANRGSENSGSCQFFITSELMPQWNGKYSIFGQIVSGQNVVDKINKQPVKNERPLNPAILHSVTIVRISASETGRNASNR
jgi:cyclophilin family peptidyl-prolyl cis-trans isomerase